MPAFVVTVVDHCEDTVSFLRNLHMNKKQEAFGIWAEINIKLRGPAVADERNSKTSKVIAACL